MLPQFRNQCFQLPLIATTWSSLQSRYTEEKKTLSLPIRFILSSIEQTYSTIDKSLLQPMFHPYQSYLNTLDNYLCSRMDSIRSYCPIVNQTSDEFVKNYGDSFIFSFFNRHAKSVATMRIQHSNHLTDVRKEKKSFSFERYFQFVTNFLMIIEMYSKYIQNEFLDYIDTSRNLWKNLNMEDGRSLDEVDSFTEKCLVLGRRMIGNYRQFVYLMRFQLKRCRYVLFSFLRVQNRFRSTVWRLTKKIQMNHMNKTFNDRARHGLVTSRERVRHYLDVMMLYAAKHPWMRWRSPKTAEPPVQSHLTQRLKKMRPMFFVSSTNTSDCSEVDENYRDRCSKIFESTPYRKTHSRSNIVKTQEQIDDVLSNISSSSPEPSFDTKEILRQVAAQSFEKSDTNSSMGDNEDEEEEENRFIEQALNESDEDKRKAASVFDLSPTLASGCAV